MDRVVRKTPSLAERAVLFLFATTLGLADFLLFKRGCADSFTLPNSVRVSVAIGPRTPTIEGPLIIAKTDRAGIVPDEPTLHLHEGFRGKNGIQQGAVMLKAVGAVDP